ncbi:MAG: nicotinamide mononucleotide transporter [Sphingobacteriaceae bacterium]|nr:nicotinamide mononucleotide transporter [Sphingobacteriaceae bacterium]
MSVLATIALISGVLGVLFTIMQRIWCWPFALISVIASSIEFYNERLFGDMALQGFYFVAGVYGWYYWERNKEKEFKVTKTPVNIWMVMALITAAQSVVYYFLLKKFKGDQVVVDSILTACSITATFMMTKKWHENWAFWVLIDLAYVALYFKKEMILFAILYFIFAAMASVGFYIWRTQRSLK